MDRLLRFFEYGHLPDVLKPTARSFNELAIVVVDTISVGPERTEALRKLLEARDAALRARLHPGG